MWRMQEVLFRMSLKSEPTSRFETSSKGTSSPTWLHQLAPHLVSEGLRRRHPRRTLIVMGVTSAYPFWSATGRWRAVALRPQAR
jgi:hypothetical protein